MNKFFITLLTLLRVFQESDDWTAKILELLRTLSSVMAGIAQTIVNLVFLIFGYEIPEIIVTAVLVGFSAFFVIKNLKTLSIVLVIVVVFLIMSGSANVLRLILSGVGLG